MGLIDLEIFVQRWLQDSTVGNFDWNDRVDLIEAGKHQRRRLAKDFDKQLLTAQQRCNKIGRKAPQRLKCTDWPLKQESDRQQHHQSIGDSMESER